jgi:hypothetical protein
VSRRQLKRSLAAIALAVVVAEPFLFWDAFAGDAQVHLVFMESAAQGRFFEFNRGEVVSGETSPGYMMVGALLHRALPAKAVPVALKVIGLLSWYAVCWLVWRVARQTFVEDDQPDGASAWAAVAALVAATLGGSVYNANVGMENGLFAAITWAWLGLAVRWRWFEAANLSLRRELAMAALLGVACWLRPEAFAIAAVAWAVRAHRLRGPKIWLAGLFATMAFGALGFAFELARTGDLVPTSILSRRILAMRHTIALGPVSVDPTYAKRLLVYLPLTALFVLGVRRPATAPSAAGLRRFFVLATLVFFVLFTVGGTPHLARYLIFLMPIWVIGASWGARRLWRTQRPFARPVVALAGIAMAVLAVVEPIRRMHRFPAGQLATAMNAPALRRTRTDQLLQSLDEPVGLPVVVALEAVQLRYEVDDRIVIRSLDGRVDRSLLRFADGATVDQVGYLRDRHVGVLLEAMGYNRNWNDWSLAELNTLPPDGRLRRGDVVFRRLGAHNAFALSSP